MTMTAATAAAYDDNSSNSNSHDDVPMIILYYCYPPISIPPNQLESHASFHKTTCHQLNLGGRIRVSSEGINGVLSGQLEKLRMYDAEFRRELMRILYPDHPYCCRDIHTSVGEEEEDPTKEWLDMKYCHLRKDIPIKQQLFDSLSVKITKEVVSLIEPTSISSSSGSEKKGRARCRQRRKQRRREKQRCEILKDDIIKEVLDVGELQVEDCEDATDPTINDNPFNEATTETYQKAELTSTTRQKDNIDRIECGTAVQIQNWEKHTPAVHLSPSEWNEKLLQYSKEKAMHSEDVILLDTRNVYETRIGHFAVPQLPTFFPNTRKFSSLPQALNTEEAASALAGKQVFMYCTGELV
jgi:predicted sulfurtransferase